MAEVKLTGLDDLIARLEGFDLKAFKGEVLTSAGQELLGRVNADIGGTGKVQGWQDVFVGSGKGYVAVRAKAKTTYQPKPSYKAYEVGRITNAIESGHVAGKSGHRVAGKYMYAGNKPQAKTILTTIASQMQAEMKRQLEG